MKKILLVLTCIVAMAMMIVGCGGSDKKDAAKGNDKKITVGFSVSTQNNPFFVSLAKGVEAKAKELGVTVKVVDAQNDPAKQANDIADLLQQNISVLLVNPVDSDAISTSVKAANKANIPVICLDRSANQGDVACLVASDNVKGGEMAADYIIKKLGEKVKVAELEGIPGASASRERGEGFHKLADSKLTVVAKQTAEFDRSKGLTVAENMLQANPDIKAIFAQNDEMALGAVSALQTAGYNKEGKTVIPVFGVDATDAAKSAIKSGSMVGTIKQDAQGMASAITTIMSNYLNEKTALEGIDTANVVGTWRVNIPYSAFTADSAE